MDGRRGFDLDGGSGSVPILDDDATNPAGSAVATARTDWLSSVRIATDSLCGRDLLEQRALADLANTEHNYDPRIGQRSFDGALRMAGDESGDICPA